MLDGSASAGGELILGRRESALFFKSPLSERQQAASSDFLKTFLADFRRPRSQPPTKPQTIQHPLPRLVLPVRKECRLTVGCGSSALRWTTAVDEFGFG